MLLQLYYRGFNRKLHQINGELAEGNTIESIIEQVRELLKEEGAVFSEPILALIQGNKA